MATATLLAGSKGSRYVDRKELDGIEAPPATETWYPIAHREVVSTVIQSTRARGFEVEEEKHSLSRGNARYFGVLRLTATLVPGCRLAMAIANSVDRSMPMRALAGNVVLACQNLSMRSDLMSEVRRKHTKRGMEDFTRLITEATGKLEHFQRAETARIEKFKGFFISDTVAEALMLRGYERGIVSHLLLPELIRAWRRPQFLEFESRTLWSLENCFTGVLSYVQKGNPTRFCTLSMSLQEMLGETAGIRPEKALSTTAA